MDKERRKQLMNELRKKADMEFETSLPMSREHFNELFDCLDAELSRIGCDNSDSLTRAFLLKKEVPVEEVIKWLNDRGGYCDCEILVNVEEQFE